jgi:preprotein translocase subunit SecG
MLFGSFSNCKRKQFAGWLWSPGVSEQMCVIILQHDKKNNLGMHCGHIQTNQFTIATTTLRGFKPALQSLNIVLQTFFYCTHMYTDVLMSLTCTGGCNQTHCKTDVLMLLITGRATKHIMQMF